MEAVEKGWGCALRALELPLQIDAVPARILTRPKMAPCSRPPACLPTPSHPVPCRPWPDWDKVVAVRKPLTDKLQGRKLALSFSNKAADAAFAKSLEALLADAGADCRMITKWPLSGWVKDCVYAADECDFVIVLHSSNYDEGHYCSKRAAAGLLLSSGLGPSCARTLPLVPLDNTPLLASRLSPLASRLSPLASRLSPLAPLSPPSRLCAQSQSASS